MVKWYDLEKFISLHTYIDVARRFNTRPRSEVCKRQPSMDCLVSDKRQSYKIAR